MGIDWQPETGSSIYYSIRFSPLPFRKSVYLVFAWQQHLRDILILATDPGVSRLKLDWWQQELARAVKKEARHPLAIQLQPLLENPDISALFQSMLQAADRDLRLQSTPTINDWYIHCDQWGESLVQLLLLASSGGEDDYQQVKGLGRYIEVVHRISSLPRINADFHLPLPDNTDLQTLVSPLKNQVNPIFQNTRCTPVLATTLSMTAQTLALDKKLRKHQYEIHAQTIDILPITRLWHAWRASLVRK